MPPSVSKPAASTLSPGLRVVTITAVDRLDDLAGAAGSWNRLVEQSPQQLPTSSHAWVSSYLQHRIGPGERWVCYLAYHGEELVGVLPLVVDRPGVRFLGRERLRLPGDMHTVSVDLACKSGEEGDVVGALIRRAFDDHPRASCLYCSRISGQSSVVRWLDLGAGVPRHTSKWDGHGAYLTTQGSYEEYKAQLSPKFRQNQAYYRKQIAKLPGYGRRTLEGPEAKPEFLQRFMQVEAANWKGEAGTAVLNSEHLREFYGTLVAQLYACGWLRWEFIEVEERPIAAVMAIHLDSRYVVWKIAYDTTHKRLSAGTILLDEVIKSSFEDSRTGEFDLLSDYPYYSKWRVSMRSYYNVCLYRADWTTWLLYYAPARLRIGLRRIPYVHTVWAYLKVRLRRIHP